MEHITSRVSGASSWKKYYIMHSYHFFFIFCCFLSWNLLFLSFSFLFFMKYQISATEYEPIRNMQRWSLTVSGTACRQYLSTEIGWSNWVAYWSANGRYETFYRKYGVHTMKLKHVINELKQVNRWEKWEKSEPPLFSKIFKN